MSFIDDLKKKLQGIGAQLNPFDNGATYSTVVNNKPAPTPTPSASSVAPARLPQPGQAPQFSFAPPKALPAPFPTVKQPTITPPKAPSSQPSKPNAVASAAQGFGDLVNNGLVKPAVNTVTGFTVDPIKTLIAQGSGDQAAYQAADKQMMEDQANSIPGMIATPLFNAAKYTAGAIVAPYAEKTAQEQADYARRVLNNNTGDPVHDAAVEAYANDVKTRLLNQHLASTAGIDMNTPTSLTMRHLASPFLQTALLAASGTVGKAGEVIGEDLATAGLSKGAANLAGHMAGSVPVGYGFDVAGNLDNPNLHGKQVLTPGAATALSVVLPIATHGLTTTTRLAINGARKLSGAMPPADIRAVVDAARQHFQTGQLDQAMTPSGHISDNKLKLSGADTPDTTISNADMQDIIGMHRKRFGDSNVQLVNHMNPNVEGDYTYKNDMINLANGRATLDTFNHESIHKAIGQFLSDGDIENLYKDTIKVSGGKRALLDKYRADGYQGINWREAAEEEIANKFVDFLKNGYVSPGLNSIDRMAMWAKEKGVPEPIVRIMYKLANSVYAHFGGGRNAAASNLENFYNKVDSGEFNGARRRAYQYDTRPTLTDKLLNTVVPRNPATAGLKLKVSHDQFAPESEIAPIVDAARQHMQAGQLDQARMLADTLPKDVRAQLHQEIDTAQAPAAQPAILTHEQAVERARQNGTTPIYEMANSIMSAIDTKDVSRRADAAKAKANVPAVQPLPTDTQAPIDNGPMETSAPTPLVDKHLEQIVTDYADMLKSMDEGAVGGRMIENNSGPGAPTYTRTSDHTPIYRQFYAENGRAPSASDWLDIARKQLATGKADPYIQKEFNDYKNNSGYYESLFGSAPANEPTPTENADQLRQEALQSGQKENLASPEDVARALGIAPSRVGDLLPNAMDTIIARTTGKRPEEIMQERVKTDLLRQRRKAAEAAVTDYLKNLEDPSGREAFLSAKEIYKETMGRVNGGDAEAAKAVQRLQGQATTPAAANPLKYTIPEVQDGDYARARSNPQVVNSLINNRLAQLLEPLNRLSHDDKVNFWKTVEGTLSVDKADSPKAMQLAIDRWRELADTVHAINASLGGRTPYIARYARHNWDLTDPEQAAKFQEIVNKRRGGYYDPYDFGGVNRLPRVFNSVAEGEAAGFKLANPDSPVTDALQYANGASAALEKQALAKAFTEADAGQPLKNRAFDLRNGNTIPLSERGIREIQSYTPIGEVNRLWKLYRTANRSTKQVVLSVSLFHSVNINMLQAFPTLIARGHPVKALEGAAKSWVALFSPRFGEMMHQGFLNDGSKYSDGLSTTEFAAKIGSPLRFGSDFAESGHLIVGKNTFFERAIFDRSIAAMQATMVQAAHNELLARGVSAESPEALQVGLEINKIMGFINKEVENRYRHSGTISSDILLAPQFTRAKYSILKDAITKWGKPGSAKALPGSYARSAVIGKYVMEATVALAAGYFMKQKSDNVKDILLRALIRPSIPTPFKDDKGNNIEIGLPHNFISEIANLGLDLNRGQDGHLGAELASPADIKKNLEDYLRARLATLPSSGLKAWINQNFAGNPIRDETASPKTQAIQTATNLVNDQLPIALQGAAQTDLVRNHLPSDVKSGLKVSTSGGNQLIKSAASSFGFTPRTDQTVGKGAESKAYFDALQEAGSGLNHQEKDALDLVTGSKKNAVSGDYQIMPTVYDASAKADALLQNPKVIDRLVAMNKQLQAQGQTTDPLWNLSKDQITKYLQYERIDKNNTGQLTKWQQDNKDWYPSFTDARSAYFDSLPVTDPNKPKLDIQPPKETPQIKDLFNQYDGITDSKQKVQFLNDHPELSTYMDGYTEYTNKLLSAQGLTPLKSYPKASPDLESYISRYNAADKATRKSIRNADPKQYQNMIAFYDSLDLYTIGKESAVNRLQGEPDSSSKENKAISSLSQDIYKTPAGSYNIVPAGWMSGMTNGLSGASSAHSSSRKYRRRLTRRNLSLDSVREAVAGVGSGPSKRHSSGSARIATHSKLPTLASQTNGLTRTERNKAALKKLFA